MGRDVRSLVVSDLHLGSITGRDVLRAPAARERLLEALDGIDRLVLLGDVVELLEGRPSRAMAEAEPVLRALGARLGRGRDVLLVPGNHDHRLVAPHLRRLRAEGGRLAPSARVPARSGRELEALTGWLRPARVEVRYPGAFLAPGVWAHHGHYVDRELLPALPRPPAAIAARLPTLPALPEGRARPEDYERAPGSNLVAVQAALTDELPPVVNASLETVAGLARGAAVRATPLLAATLADRLAPLGAGLLGWQFRARGLGAMAAVVRRLGVRARHVVFGHLHHGGPFDERWRDGAGGLELHNTGSWVYEPLLLSGVTPPHPYWPGGAVVVESGALPRAEQLLTDLAPADLAVSAR